MIDEKYSPQAEMLMKNTIEDFEEDLTGEEMKTFKQHMKEDHGYAGGQVGTATSVSPEDSNITSNYGTPRIIELSMCTSRASPASYGAPCLQQRR